MNRVLLHVLTRQQDAQRDAQLPWVPPAYVKDGFIHLCTREQLVGVFRRHFAGKDAVALVLDETRLKAPVMDEDLYGHGSFPHLYGPLPPDAVIKRVELAWEHTDASILARV